MKYHRGFTLDGGFATNDQCARAVSMSADNGTANWEALPPAGGTG